MRRCVSLTRRLISERQIAMCCIWKGLAVAFSLVTASVLSAAAAETPLVPIVSGLEHWAHHWYIWLPGDPAYEAVEVMAAERGPGAVPLVWVFFTERDGPKRQIQYYNDPLAAAVAGRPIKIGVSFGPDARLMTEGAGLTNQIGHSGDRMLLMFFREKNAFAQTWHATIADTDASVPQPGQNRPTPFPAAYSSNIFVGYFPFDDLHVSFTDARPGEEKGVAHFTPTGVMGTYSAARPDGTSVELATGPDAALRYYRHRSGVHTLEVSFVPPLPSPARLSADADSTYRISLDGFHDLLAGRVHASRRDDAIILDWEFNAPDWTRAHPLRTTAFLRDGNIARIELRPVSTDR